MNNDPLKDVLVGTYESSTLDEKLNIVRLLKDFESDVDCEILPYLVQINLLKNFTTIYSCWGHPNGGYILFRADKSPIEMLQIMSDFYQYRRVYLKKAKLIPFVRLGPPEKLCYSLDFTDVLEDNIKHKILKEFIVFLEGRSEYIWDK